MKYLYFYILIFLFPSLTFSQPFEIAWGTTTYFSLDRYANDIYYFFTPANKFYKTNITTHEATATDFPSIPRFANKSHIAVYAQQNNFILRDFEKDTSFLLFTTSQNIIDNSYSFSPNDSNIIVFNRYYSSRDSQSHSLSFEFIYWDPDYYQWSSDSTILSLEFGNVVLQYYLYSNKVDTFFFLGNNIDLSNYSYNRANNSLTYSINSVSPPPKLYLHSFETNSDSILFDPAMEDSSQIGSCWSNPISIKSITLSPNEKRTAFFNSLLTNSGSGLYVFENDSEYTNMYLDCSNYGLKYSLEWLSNDTLIYFDANISLIYGIDVRPIIDDVPQDYQNGYITVFSLEQNYPNPFNPTTKIKYTIPTPPVSSPLLKGRTKEGFVTLRVYDILGRDIATLVNEEKPVGEYEVGFDGKDLPSGIYFYQLKAGTFIQTKKMVLLK